MAALVMWPIRSLLRLVLRAVARRFARATQLRLGRGRLPDRRDPATPLARLLAAEAAAAAIAALAATLADRVARRVTAALTGRWPGGGRARRSH